MLRFLPGVVVEFKPRLVNPGGALVKPCLNTVCALIAIAEALELDGVPL